MRNGYYITDYHCHSAVSPDGHNTMAEMARAAIEKGVDELCFTDHVEPVPWCAWNDGPLPRHSYDWSIMAQDFAAAQRLCGDKIKLRVGAELGEVVLAPDVEDSFLDDAPPLDFTIGSVHTFWRDGIVDDLCWITSRETAVWHRAVDSYFTELKKLVQWGRFHVIGHLTLPLRYAKELCGLELDITCFDERICEILRSALDKGIGIELNTNRGGEPLPNEHWLKMYRSLGGEIITMGSDAHTPNYISCAMEERQELLKHCGFRYFATFAEGKPIFHKL